MLNIKLVCQNGHELEVILFEASFWAEILNKNVWRKKIRKLTLNFERTINKISKIFLLTTVQYCNLLTLYDVY